MADFSVCNFSLDAPSLTSDCKRKQYSRIWNYKKKWKNVDIGHRCPPPPDQVNRGITLEHKKVVKS
jgi:hypothetical protein